MNEPDEWYLGEDALWTALLEALIELDDALSALEDMIDDGGADGPDSARLNKLIKEALEEDREPYESYDKRNDAGGSE